MSVIRLLLFALALGLVACSSSDPSLDTAPADWRATVVEQIQARQYGFAAGPTLRANNPAQGYRVAIDAAGVQVTGDGWVLSLGGGAADAVLTGGRIERQHAGWTEWFTNGPEGLRQGWTVPSGGDALVLPVSIDAQVRVQPDGRSALLWRDDLELRYGGLAAWDADGIPLAAHLEATADGLAVHVDTTGAAWPVTVDPVLTSPTWTINGVATDGFLGETVSGIGDVNGDGFEDVLVGIPGAAGGGAVALYLGGATGPATTATWNGAGPAGACNFGGTLARVGDLNGDGFDDIVVGDDCAGPGAADNTGRVDVWYGIANPVQLSANSDWNAIGSNTSSNFGSAIAGGHLTNDDFADLVIGASGDDAVAVYVGASAGLAQTAAGTITASTLGTRFGAAVGAAGDVNGDGLEDILVGSPHFDGPGIGGNSGRVELLLATGAAIPLSAPQHVGYGLTSGDQLGTTVVGIGDIDGDGDTDLAAGAPFSEFGGNVSAGRVHVWLVTGGMVATSTPIYLEGEVSFTSWGDALAAVGDVNGDGFADLGVGGSGNERYGVYFGGPTGIQDPPGFDVFGPANTAAGELAGGGDVNGDGLGDLLVGAPFANANDSGSVTLYYGARGGPSASFSDSDSGDGVGDQLGIDVAGVGDVNGDGYDDVLVGAHQYDNGESDEGAAFLYLGTATGLDVSSPAWSDEGGVADANFGEAVSGAGDVNGDGFDDWIVGAPDHDSGLSGAGRAALYLGSSTVAGTTASFETTGAHGNARLGSDVAGGDVNGDGYSDVIVGSRLFTDGQSNEGKVDVWYGDAAGISGAADWSAQSDANAAQLGVSVAFLGDVNGDGFGDVAAGAPEYTGALGSSGAVLVWHGSASGLPGVPSWSTGKTGGWTAFGSVVADAGDVDGDGDTELLVGDPFTGVSVGGEGRVVMFSGSPTGLGAVETWSTNGSTGNDACGTGLGGVGDVDGDGYADVAVGCAANSGGAVRVYPGSDTGLGTSAMSVRTASGSDQGLGNALSAADVNGDGVSDLIVGARFSDISSGGNQGRFHVIPGNSSDVGAWHASPPTFIVTDPSGAVMTPGRRSSSPDTLVFDAALARGPHGPTEVAIEVEVKPWPVPFDGTSTVLGAWAIAGPTPINASATALNLAANTPMRWRARLRYRQSRAEPHGWGPWTVGGRPGHPEGVHLRTACQGDYDGDGLCDSDDPDDDNDGDPDATDCDDNDDTVFTGATEVCDGVDQDCSGSLVDGLFDDTDGDGEPDCFDSDDDGDGTGDGGDCAPLNADQFPGNPEVCDGLDNDCDGVVEADEVDDDGDGWRICDGDCDDTLASVNPGASETDGAYDCLDTDCDGEVPPAESIDTDLDGVLVCADCDDEDPLVRPGAEEICDGKDSDCDGELDLNGLFTGEDDADGDGFSECEGDCDDDQDDQYPGAPEAGDSPEDLNCDGVFGQGVDADGDGSSITDVMPDCDDGDPERFPGNPEICDGIDNDCDGLAFGETADADGDGFVACMDCNEADPEIPSTDTVNREVCDGWNSDCDPDGFPDPSTADYDLDGDGVAVCEGDCADDDPARNPEVPETCDNGIDDDCDGDVDEDLDSDGDGVSTCDGDCDDDDPGRAPGATEICDGIDQDCDGLVDDDFDADVDGVADCGDGPDCDDDDPTVYPGAPELCDDAKDNDCDPATWAFADLDGDGQAPCPDGDCDDTSDAVSAVHDEVCDGIDNDCDGEVDEDLDTDNDGLVWCTGDCAEGDPQVRAGLPELCDDGIDQDCDQIADEDCAGEPLDVVFPAGCVCDASRPAEVPGVLALLLLAALAPRRRR